MPRSFLSAFHSPADSTVLPPRLRSLRPPVRPFEARWPAVERDHSSREGRRFKKNSRAGPPTVKRARGAHIVIRGSRLEAEREREDRGSKMASGRFFVQPMLSGVQLPATVGTHSSLARCFCERVLPLPGQPVVRSLARSLTRSLARLSTLRRRFCPSVPGPGVRRGPEFHGKSLGYIFTSGAIKAVGVRPFLD